MSAASLLLPPALLAAAALACGGLALRGVPGARLLAGGAGWLALAVAPTAWWLAGHQAVELPTPITVGTVPAGLRLDALSLTVEIAVLVPFALLAAAQRRTGLEAAVASAAACAALLTIEVDRLALAALGLATCASLAGLALRGEDERGFRAYWASLAVAWTLLLWAAATLEVLGGTSAYGAAPVTALRVPVFLLLAAAAVAAAGLVPWRSWVSAAWLRPRLEAGSLAAALIPPLGFLLLLRAYGLGSGHWPSPSLNVAMAVVGAATALGAGLRTQAAAALRDVLAESVPMSGGLALVALAVGSPLGVGACLAALVGSGLLAGLAPLVAAPTSGRRAPAVRLVGLAVVAGAPPALVFGGRLLALQAAFEAGGAFAFLSLAGGLAWLLAIAGAARALRLPERGGEGAGRTGRGPAHAGAMAGIAIALAAGVGLGVLVERLAAPAAAEVTGSSSSVLTGGPLSVTTPSGGWAAVLLGAPLLVLATITYRYAPPVAMPAVGSEVPASPEPFIPPPPAGLSAGLVGRLGGLRIAARRVGGWSPAGLEAALAGGRPWLWGAITLVVALAVAR